MSLIPVWVEVVVCVLLLTSAALSLVAAVGLVRLPRFFQRMHAPALSSTGGAWCVSAACVVYFSALERAFAPHALLVNVLLAITMPVATVLIARAVLFRQRQNKEDVPPALGSIRDDAGGRNITP